jgi:hypothetical protein
MVHSPWKNNDVFYYGLWTMDHQPTQIKPAKPPILGNFAQIFYT